MFKNNESGIISSPKLFGHNDLFVDLSNLYTQGFFPKVLLLSGSKGLGKYTTIIHLINSILSKDDYDFEKKTIYKESAFLKQMFAGICENFVHIRNDGTSKVKINDVRQIKALLQKTTINQKPRFIIIDDAEKLNINSSNALLKIIEEPSNNNYFILIDNKNNNLLSTIASRCIIKKVFVKNKERIEIIESLIEFFNIDSVINYKTSDITPGNFILFNNVCLTEQMDVNCNFITRISKLLNMYKKTKNNLYIDMCKYFTDLYYYNYSLKNSEKIDQLQKSKFDTLLFINNFVLYNLGINSILSSIESVFIYEK